MWPYLPELLDKPVPRYTSYPTAAEFRDDVNAADTAAALDGVRGDISLYVHIPFCESICWYCACNTGAANRRQRLASYLDVLASERGVQELRLAVIALETNERGATLATIRALGGGFDARQTPPAGKADR